MRGKHTFAIRVALGLAFSTAMVLPLSTLGGNRAVAQDSSGFDAYMAQLGRRAIAQGVTRQTVDAVIPTLTFNQRVVDLDRSQPGGNPASPASAIPAFAPYRAKHVDDARIARGRAKYQSLRGLLARVERETGVPESIMVSIWGNETNYGSYTGDFDLPRSLASLAYDGRRRELFETEFIDSLKIIDRGISRDTIKGSWAGATGLPQFLPSMYLKVARDGDGNGRIDIWNSEADALASIANYFVQAGWRPNQPWGVAVSVPVSLNRAVLINRTVSPRCPRVHDRHTRWLTVGEWRSLGVTPTGRTLPDSTLASLLEPDGPGATAYLLTGNYRVILDYNCSNFYALSVALLSDAVQG
ncbi:MAG: lytic murein transglycosylase [Sphingomonadales bacterium]|jgi:membrane-bound lytic murein transglycosylase B|nr:lytic murein transglycosylase [Sphingomonadales bacterium]